jgi:hypothetical protein
VIQHPSNVHTPATGNNRVTRPHATPNASKDPAEQRCFNYSKKGHYAHVCPKPCLHPNQTSGANPLPNQCANSVPMTARQNLARGRVNQVIVKEAQNAQTVVTGTFIINLNNFLTIPWSLFLLRGVVLSHLKILNFGMWLKFTKLKKS